MVTEYLGFYIQHDPPAIPIRAFDWQYYHHAYNGPEDGRSGTAASEQDAKELIREYWLDHSEFWIQEDFHDGWYIVKDKKGNSVHYAHRHDAAEWWIIQKELGVDIDHEREETSACTRIDVPTEQTDEPTTT